VIREIRRVVARKAEENPTWGYTRSRGALKNVGHHVARSTIAPDPERAVYSSDGFAWPSSSGTFLPAHWGAIGGVTIPVSVSANPSEIYTAPKSWAERAFPKLLHYGRTSKGCHFAAWEQPKIFTDEVRASFKTLLT
jgi:hypothetical protein